MVLTAGFDYYCSIDSGWSLNGGDQYGCIVPDNANIFTRYKSLVGFAEHAHSQGYKVGISLLPGAFVGDGWVTIENTSIKIGDVFDTSVTYNLRHAFNWAADGVQQWHDSVVCNKCESSFVALGSCAAGSSEELVSIPLTALCIGAGMGNGADA